ncbi:hypothetical protein ILYODFUR_033732 [Ilyodon furcidens]|uniref:Uncharacterized protein n=1 Tax=Ilyodon furcidens TaxID=33524 RepID=A0ABV0TZZ0_9TELE
MAYTVDLKTADLQVVQQLVEACCSQGAVFKHVIRKLSGRKKCGRERCNKRNCSLERIVKQNPLKNMGGLHKEWTVAGDIKGHYGQTHGLQMLHSSCLATPEPDTSQVSYLG